MARRNYEPAIFKHANKLNRLLDMMYKPSELAAELDVTYDTVMRSYMKAGCPFEKDATGHTWINGVAFANWGKQINSERVKRNNNSEIRIKLKENEAYCFHCKKPMVFNPTEKKPVGRSVEMIKGTCLTCGTTVNKLQGINRK